MYVRIFFTDGNTGDYDVDLDFVVDHMDAGDIMSTPRHGSDRMELIDFNKVVRAFAMGER